MKREGILGAVFGTVKTSQAVYGGDMTKPFFLLVTTGIGAYGTDFLTFSALNTVVVNLEQVCVFADNALQ